jgi:pilus assembly protein CpaF
MESDSDLIQTALANLTLPDYFPDWLFSQNSMADALRDGFPLPSATRSVRTDSVLRGIRVGFLKPIEHLILDDSISEVMVNGGDRVFIEKAGYLNILGRFIPEDERILLIEDTAEIQLSHANLVRFEARRPDNGVLGIAIRDLLKATLRHRPDRILLGEIRGGEAFNLQLLNTGHAGTLSTIHANSAKQGPVRFTSCVLQSGVELPYRAIKSNIADSLHVVIQIERRPGRRYISEVLEINSYDADGDPFDYCAIYQR